MPGQARNRSSSSTLALVLACTGAVAATAAVGAAVAATGKPDEHAALYRPTKRLVARMLPAVRSVHTVELLGSLNIATMPIKPALRYYLVRHGVRALAPGSYLRLGSWYELYHRSYQEVLYVENGVRKPVPGVQLLDRVHFGTGWGPQTVSLWRYPHPGSGGPTATHAPKHRPRASLRGGA